MSGQYKHPGAGAGTQTVGPRPTNRTRGDLGPDNFCGEIKVLESDRFLFFSAFVKLRTRLGEFNEWECGSNHVYTGHSPHDLMPGIV